MSNSNGVLGFVVGAVVGAAAGVVAGILIAPRAGAETRGMVAQGANDAWGQVVDTCQKGAQEAVDRANVASGDLGCKTDELREKVDQARARMDQIRSSLANSAACAAETVTEAVTEAVSAAVPETAPVQGEAPATA